MKKLMNAVRGNRIVKDKKGATAIEYGLIAALLSVGIIAGLTPLKESINSTFGAVSTQMGTAATTAGQ